VFGAGGVGGGEAVRDPAGEAQARSDTSKNR
jgi:hypothetical protein